MESQRKLNFNLKKFIQKCIFLIGVGILVWQSETTFATFFSFRTTLAISKETSESLPPPTIVFCQQNKWDNGFRYNDLDKDVVNFSDTNWVFGQFYRLKDKMNISIFGIEVAMGKNSISLDEFSRRIYGGSDMIFMVKELLNPWAGLCNAIIPDPRSTPMKQSSVYMANIQFSQEVKDPMLYAYLINSEDLPGLILYNFGPLKPFKIPLTELKTAVGIDIEERKYLHLQDSFYLPSSMTNCKDYSSGEDSYMKCLLKSFADNYKSMANDYGCTCVLTTYKSYFEFQPTPTSLGMEECNTTTEYMNCFSFAVNLELLPSECPIPCKKMDYKGEIFQLNGGYHSLKDNEIRITIRYNTMDTEIRSEILTFDLATFIGTAGGSLGLFLGFTLTGFAEQVLNYFMRN